MKMKHGFTLIEAMIAIVVIFVGFGAIIAMGLSATSNANSSKAKLRATDLATGILENYRAARDANGVSGLYSMAQPAQVTIEGVTYIPVVTVYNLDSDSVIVEAKIRWTIKQLDSITSSIYLINNSTRFAAIVPPYTTPLWMGSNPTPTQTPTLTPTPACTFTYGPIVPESCDLLYTDGRYVDNAECWSGSYYNAPWSRTCTPNYPYCSCQPITMYGCDANDSRCRSLPTLTPTPTPCAKLGYSCNSIPCCSPNFCFGKVKAKVCRRF